MKILTEQGYIDAVALFFELTDGQLGRIQIDKDYIYDKKFVYECMMAKGDNAHFYCLCNNSDREIVHKHFTLLKKQYKSISWWNRDITNFHITRS